LADQVGDLLDCTRDLQQDTFVLFGQLLQLWEAFLELFYHVVIVVDGLLACFQTDPLLNARQGEPDAPLET
jgi:hypothetical protein